jgi:hypothetical protein
MSDRFLEQRIDIKVRVKLGNSASDICAMLSEDYGGEAVKESNVFEWYKRFKKSWRIEITQEDNTSLSSMLRVLFTLKSFHKARQLKQASYAEMLKWLLESVRRKRPELWPNDWNLHHDNVPAHKALSVEQFLVQNRLLKWNTHPIPLRMTCGSFQK